jgi:hypothetical protein
MSCTFSWQQLLKVKAVWSTCKMQILSGLFCDFFPQINYNRGEHQHHQVFMYYVV